MTKSICSMPAIVRPTRWCVFQKPGLRGIVWVKNADFEPRTRLPTAPAKGPDRQLSPPEWQMLECPAYHVNRHLVGGLEQQCQSNRWCVGLNLGQHAGEDF